MTAAQHRRCETGAIAAAGHRLLPEVPEPSNDFARQTAAEDEGLGSVGGREGHAGEAAQIDPDAGGYSGEETRGAVATADGEKGDGVGVGVLNLMGSWVSG